MLVGKVSSWARANSANYQSAGTLEKLQTALANPDVSVVIVDLQFRGLDIAALATEIRAAVIDAKLVGYAQHVMTDLIAAGEAAGFDAVLTRGQFDRQFAEWMQ